MAKSLKVTNFTFCKRDLLVLHSATVRDNLPYTANERLVKIQYKCLVQIYVFPEMKLRGLVIQKQNYNVLSPNFTIHVSVSDL